MTVLTLSGCSGIKNTLLGLDGAPLSAYAMLVTSPNMISIPAGKTITVSATIVGQQFSGIDYNRVSIQSSQPSIATARLNKTTSPYQFEFKSLAPRKTFITIRFDNNPDTDLTIEAVVYEIRNIETPQSEARDGGS